MYAVIETGGKQYRVEVGTELEVELLDVEPGVAETVVIGLPHPRWSEAITAVIVPRRGAHIDEAALLQRLRGRLSPYKCPKAFIVVDSLPKTPAGKVQKLVLRQRFADHYRTAAPNLPAGYPSPATAVAPSTPRNPPRRPAGIRS